MDTDRDRDPPDASAAAPGYDRSDAPGYETLAADLRDRVDGGVAFDEYARVLYATDGSVHSARPARGLPARRRRRRVVPSQRRITRWRSRRRRWRDP